MQILDQILWTRLAKARLKLNTFVYKFATLEHLTHKPKDSDLMAYKIKMLY